jgi:hypothetical protein
MCLILKSFPTWRSRNRPRKRGSRQPTMNDISDMSSHRPYTCQTAQSYRVIAIVPLASSGQLRRLERCCGARQSTHSAALKG